jgi:predicted RNA-binding protein with PIN domain
MIIIIDGYNFLKSITGTKFISESQMREWINYFQKYLFFRGNQIIMVFDAGPSFFESNDRHGSVDVWYAGQHQTADDWIKNWLTKNKHKDILLVSSDREIRDWADSLSVVSLSSQDFYKILHSVVKEEELEQKIQMQSLHKTKENEAADTYLDNLMEIGSRNIVSVYKENEYTQDIERTPKNKQDSKSDKAVLRKINKI